MSPGLNFMKFFRELKTTDGYFATEEVDAHRLFLIWLIWNGIFLVFFFITWDTGLIGTLFATDSSYISQFISVIYVATTIHAGMVTFRASHELTLTHHCMKILRGMPPGPLSDNKLTFLPECFFTHSALDLLRIFSHGEDTGESDRKALAALYCRSLRNGSDTGWFIADMLIKLGLLGTVVGFVMMLGSVTDITTFDTSVMQDILRKMSKGMGIALYTTIAGLILAGMLGITYHLLDRETNRLEDAMANGLDVEILPRLSSSANGNGAA